MAGAVRRRAATVNNPISGHTVRETRFDVRFCVETLYVDTLRSYTPRGIRIDQSSGSRVATTRVRACHILRLIAVTIVSKTLHANSCERSRDGALPVFLLKIVDGRVTRPLRVGVNQIFVHPKSVQGQPNRPIFMPVDTIDAHNPLIGNSWPFSRRSSDLRAPFNPDGSSLVMFFFARTHEYASRTDYSIRILRSTVVAVVGPVSRNFSRSVRVLLSTTHRGREFLRGARVFYVIANCTRCCRRSREIGFNEPLARHTGNDERGVREEAKSRTTYPVGSRRSKRAREERWVFPTVESYRARGRLRTGIRNYPTGSIRIERWSFLFLFFFLFLRASFENDRDDRAANREKTLGKFLTTRDLSVARYLHLSRTEPE